MTDNDKVKVTTEFHAEPIEAISKEGSNLVIQFPAIVPSSSPVTFSLVPSPSHRLSSNSLVIPGSFNPLHFGHEEVAIQSLKLLSELHKDVKYSVIFEMSIVNADKPTMLPEELNRRCMQFVEAPQGPWCVALTNAPLFVHKSRLFPECYFAVGIDTAIRLLV
jgi:hypothetical protein